MCNIPLIDWNGNGQIDPQDIALSLAGVIEENDTIEVDTDEEE